MAEDEVIWAGGARKRAKGHNADNPLRNFCTICSAFRHLHATYRMQGSRGGERAGTPLRTFAARLSWCRMRCGCLHESV